MDSIVDLRRAAVVVAHPDDELLWFSSLGANVGRIIMCYGAVSNVPERAEQRRKVVLDYPLDTVQFFDLPQPRFFRGMSSEVFRRETTELADENPAFRTALTDKLRAALHGITTVFVHNPWGEYGHQDHRRVNMAVNALRREMDFTVYVSCYAERQVLSQIADALDEGIGDILSFPTNPSEIEPIFRLYQSHFCWTWTANWTWPKEEQFFRVGHGASVRAEVIPFHVFRGGA